MGRDTILKPFGLENFKIEIEFPNGTYTVKARNDDLSSDVLYSLRINSDYSILDGNPTGIVNPSSFSVALLCNDAKMNPFNSSSPFYGSMRAGIPLNVYRNTGLVEEHYVPYGKFYIEAWSTTKEEGSFGLTEISGSDILSWLGNQEIPDLTHYQGASARSLLEAVFNGLGLAKGTDYVIDDTLDLDMLTSVAKGARVRDVINNIAQAMLARVYVDRFGIIKVEPSYKTEILDEEILGTIGPGCIESFNVSKNTASLYSKVRLSYTIAGNQETSEVATAKRTIKYGDNTFLLEISKSVLSLDSVYVDVNNTSDGVSLIDNITYRGQTGGITITLKSSSKEDLSGTIVVLGVEADADQSYATADVPEYSTSSFNVLELSSDIIQTEAVAQEYVNNVARYLNKIDSVVSIKGTLPPSIEAGKYIYINTSDSKMNGIYLVTGTETELSESFSMNVSAIKMKE